MASDWVELPFREALDYLLSLRPITKEELDLLEEQVAVRAFTVAHIFKIETLQEMLDSITSALKGDSTLELFIEQFEETGLSAAHLETVYRTNLQSAFGRGIWEQGTDPDIQAEVWGWRYHTVGDDRVREEHEALDEMIFKTGERDEIFPPWDFNCRCTAEWISLQEAIDEGYESSDVPSSVLDSINETEFTSPALDDEYVPDVSGYDPDLQREYLQEE